MAVKKHKNMISLTAKAINKIREIAKEEDINDLCLRMKIIGGGCAGFSYDVFFEHLENVTDFDETFKNEDITICIDPLSFQYLSGCEMDFVTSNFGAGFKFKNPNVTSTCGCGSSVSF